MKLVKSIGIGLLSCSFAMLQAAVPLRDDSGYDRQNRLGSQS